MKDEAQLGHGAVLRTALDGVCNRSNGQGLTIGVIFSELRERGYLMGLVFLTVPFLFPLPTMGLSGPVGLVVMLTWIALMLGRNPWMPGFISRRKISHDVLIRLATCWTRAVDRFGPLMRPRWSFMFWPGLRLCIGLGLVSAGFVLSLPLPIPFTNAIPAAAILMLCLGYIVEDGLMVLLGYGVGAGAWGFLYVVGDVAWLIIRRMCGPH